MVKTMDGAARTTRGGRAQGTLGTRWGFRIFAAFAVAGALLLALEHRAHVLGVLPWLILLACPLMHLFMHHGHGHGSRHHERSESRRVE